MKRKKHPRWWVILLAVILVAFALPFYLDLHRFLRPLPQDFEQAMQQEMAAAKIPGAAMLIMKEGQAIYGRGFGLADPETGREVTTDTLFTIASISKTVTATALMTLYEQGAFQLDDDVDAYVPFSVRNPKFPDTAITFRMLLAHTSSIQDSGKYNSWYTLHQKPVLEDSPIPLDEFVQGYFTPGSAYYSERGNFTRNAPGSAYKYSNCGFALLGYLVEQLSGQPFDQYSRQAVFEPLGMAHTAWLFRDVDKSLMAVPYTYNSLLRRMQRVGFFGYPSYPDGSLKTSVNDFARFLHVFLYEGKTMEGEQFLQPGTVREMLRVQYPDAGAAVGLAWHLNGDSANHTGGDPGINTLAVANPQKKVSLILFTNGDGGDMGITGMLRMTLFYRRMSPLIKLLY